MRPPFAPRGPFDPREADSFFRPPFDDIRGRPGPHLRPPFGPMGPPAMHGPDGGPWRNQESSGIPTSWPAQEAGPDGHGQRENHLPRDKQKLVKQHPDFKGISERENRNRNRKSRWGNVSPPLMDADADAEALPSEEAENKMVRTTLDGGEFETKEGFDQDAPSTVTDQQSHPMQLEQNESAILQNALHGDGNNELTGMSNDEGGGGDTIHNYGNDDGQVVGTYEAVMDRFCGDDMALKQQGEEEQCEYEAPIPAEDSAQQSATQPEEIGHVSENYSEQLVEQQTDSV